MDLQKTIADLEAQARQFTEAANALRALAGGEKSGAKVGRKPGPKPGRKAVAKKAGKKRGRKGPMSPETKAKIAAAQRAAHARRKATK